ncbi:hypothetical protein IQ07DRAFT_676626 [Pyrenochaeta sp. DS3sAY3a]|nr:hypothetical protein IQ07DRAFT_676626 [Pyrenochaeta sp. DS3sAY3a]
MQRLFCEYVYSIIPIISCEVLATVFGDSQDVSPFMRLLRIVIIAATAPFLGPGDKTDDGKNRRDQVIDQYYQEARNVLENSPGFTPLQCVQGLLLLSFCARRHVGIAAPENRFWLHLAIAKLQQLYPRDTDVYRSREPRLSRRIWWTCYLYERLDAFSSTTSPEFHLHAESLEPLTLDDFEIGTALQSWRADDRSMSEIDFVAQDLRLASMHVQKIWLVQQIVDNALLHTLEKVLMPPPAPKKSSNRRRPPEKITSRHFWRANTFENEFHAWQQRTGNDLDAMNLEGQHCPHIAVHWTSLYMLYCRIAITCYHQSNAVLGANASPSQADHVQGLLERERIQFFAGKIIELTRNLHRHGQAVYAHATDPTIWMSLLGAVQTVQHPSISLLEDRRTTEAIGVLVDGYEQDLLHWKSVPSPKRAQSPECHGLAKREVEVVDVVSEHCQNLSFEAMLVHVEDIMYNIAGSGVR